MRYNHLKYLWIFLIIIKIIYFAIFKSYIYSSNKESSKIAASLNNEQFINLTIDWYFVNFRFYDCGKFLK